jgi:hypothetical protein
VVEESEGSMAMTKDELIKEAEALRTDAFCGRGLDKHETVAFMTELISFLRKESDPIAKAQR